MSEDNSAIFQLIFKIQEFIQEEMLKKSHVVGVAAGFKETEGTLTDQPSLVVLVDEKRPLSEIDNQDRVPKDIEGVKTDVYVVGKLRANNSPKARFRPIIPLGVSMGHYASTAGTLGALVRDNVTGEIFVLSNNHVFANCNFAQKGDPILQPAPLDGGMNPGDMVATLERFIPLRYLQDSTAEMNAVSQIAPSDVAEQIGGRGCNMMLDIVLRLLGKGGSIPAGGSSGNSPSRGGNSPSSGSSSRPNNPSGGTSAQNPPPIPGRKENLVDCALGKIIAPAQFDTQIPSVGYVAGTKAVNIGMTVVKHGRTTGLRKSTVTLLNATVDVGYSTPRGERTARFTAQILTGGMSEGGDSGSLVIDPTDNMAVGLLFGGSPQASLVTPIGAVLSALNVSLL
ncbi:MAG: S1 family peptidase [Anaerolineae bacterium]|nr:S1 family peptidase [Anaerolineae bacterium]